ncbi:hypothetical protein [Gordonia rhizosphera]|uniref:Uncharacterized protein n=1 Tax=Gordonia rhizosphera NBRC 16068 TaxID=1108045 RepID=K6V7L7_9ACTN|nr:hypothetical protein [Gordonia rhizosphera]GAB92223.1 hypothetical protein GORHZ_168_00200 [Gordonia rhizosphera NBRC 16068]
MAHLPKRSRNDHPECAGRRRPVLMGITSAALVASIATGVGAGMAQAAPEQGGTSPSDTAPQQGGTTPAPSPSAPEQGGTTPTPEPVPVEPVYTPGPGSIPGPPQEAPYQPYVAPSVYTAPTYEENYEVTPIQTLNAPKPAAPVRPIAPPPEKIRVGNFITDIPEGMSDKDVNSINAWAAYGEAKIAQGLISMGVPADEASRQAASTIIGVATGGTAGAVAGAALAAPAGALTGLIVGVPVGAIAGLIYNAVTFAPLIITSAGTLTPAAPFWLGLGAAGGAGIGLVAGPVIGAAVFGAAGAVAGAVAGGTAGGALAYALGAGDPGANPEDPWKQGEAEPMPNPDANQFQVNLPAEEAKQVGLPAANYTVNVRGDVSVQVGDMKTGWTAEQAQAPYNALGALAGSQVENAARTFVKDNAPKLENLIPGVKVSWPQEIAPVN